MRQMKFDFGETKRRMADRFTEYLRARMPGLSIATQFSNDHSTDDIKITGINLYKGPDHIAKTLNSASL